MLLESTGSRKLVRLHTYQGQLAAGNDIGIARTPLASWTQKYKESDGINFVAQESGRVHAAALVCGRRL
jgi:hypothetical protein